MNGAEAVNLARTRTIDVFLMDILMPTLDDVAATSQILQANRRTRVLLLTAFDDDTFLDGAIVAGASGFLLKNTPPAKVADAVRAVAAGGKVLSPGPTSRVLERYCHGSSPQAQSAIHTDLSEREQEVLRLLCQARSNRQIAHQLHLGETTVKTYVSTIMRKMGATSRLEAVVEAFRHGLSD
ncbi:LuxR C-terminal-related transcriptional regulator [Actinomyces wuliandei]|uniref:LuxR C-terminal-related transcriptional regulator n=1 Tax=Actinomyces wuliandei TaxID=2057743 RepID=UPI0015D60D6E|nr:response regulator transcription factor [Actinomyces wuliandei]